METSTCSKCGVEKPLNSDYFHKKKRNKRGFSYSCKECRNRENKEYKEKNKEAQLEYNKKWQKNNKDKVSMYQKAYYEKNKEEINRKSVEYQKKHPEINIKKRQKRRADMAELPNDLTIEEWNVALVYFDNGCAYCGDRKSVLHQEHVQALSRGGGYTQGNIIPACKRCNASKNNRDMFTWYGIQDFFSSDRLEKIEDYILEFGNVRKVKRYYLDGFGPDSDNNAQE